MLLEYSHLYATVKIFPKIPSPTFFEGCICLFS